jgi:hypothetical protein
LIASLILAAALACGVERAAVKHVTDLTPGSVRDSMIASAANPTPTTVEDLASIKLANPVKGNEPRGLSIDKDTGAYAGVEEFHVYQVECLIPFAKVEADHDFHIVCQDGVDSMVVESVDPRCAPTSPFVAEFAAVRKAIGLNGPKGLIGKRARITGVGFFDKLHGQTGVAPDGFELHPLLSIEILE